MGFYGKYGAQAASPFLRLYAIRPLNKQKTLGVLDDRIDVYATYAHFGIEKLIGV